MDGAFAAERLRACPNPLRHGARAAEMGVCSQQPPEKPMRTILVAAFLLAAVPTVVRAQDASPRDELGEGAILYGEDFAFMIGAPENWAIDSRIGHQLGVLAVMYPRDPGWTDAPAVMYAAHFDKVDTLTFAQVVALDLERTRRESPGIEIERVDPIVTSAGDTAVVYHTTGDRHGNHDAVAFVDQPTVVVMVVLTSRAPEAFAAILPAYEKVVASYLYMNREPETPRP